MVFTLHAASIPTACAQRVWTTLHELSLPANLITVDIMGGENKSEAYLTTKHPFGRIPVLEDDGFFLYESRAICRYIVKKYQLEGGKTDLMPEEGDLKKWALFEQACSVETSYFDHAAYTIGKEGLFTPARGGTTDEATIAKAAAELDETFKVYDGILAKQPYLAGQEFTLADLFHYPYGGIAYDIGYRDLFAKYPNVKRWWETLQARESWKKANTPSIVEALASFKKS